MIAQEKNCHGYEELRTINGIEFTEREIDVIACVLSGRTAQKTISAFLSTTSRTISPRTVETHLRNITRKVGCSSQSGVIDFIERSNKRPLTRIHYEYLQSQTAFEKKLATLHPHLSSRFRCMVYGCSQKNDFVRLLLSHLEMAGVKTSVEENTDSAASFSSQIEVHRLYVVSEGLIEQFEGDRKGQKLELSKHIQESLRTQNNLTFLLLDHNINHLPEEFSQIGVVSVNEHEDYHVLVLELLQRMIADPELSQLIKTMVLELKPIALLSAQHFVKPAVPSKKMGAFLFTLASTFKKGKNWIIPLITVSASFLYLLDWLYQGNKTDLPQVPSVIATNLAPLENTLLQRPHLMQQLEEKLKGTYGIQTVALVGIGGVGKTTLARQYAQQQKAGFIWEINAETLLSIIHSFEKMAFALCRTDEDHKFLRSIQNIKDAKEREEKILSFVKSKLQIYPNWLLIYDNVEKIADIRPYVALESHAWGEGKVIITTRDSHILQDRYIYNTIPIGGLTPQERLSIFMYIMQWGEEKSLTPTTLEETERFLNKIEPYPLDVSIAACYLKATKISYDQYLDYLTTSNPGFIAMQKKILRDANDYNLTRYDIICLSIDRLLGAHKDFGELLLLISALDSQKIPRSLLEQFKDKVIIDNFIYSLKKYSLITYESEPDSSISLHRNTQEISLQYLTKKLNLQKDNAAIQNIISAFSKYLDDLLIEKNISQMRNIMNHLEALLSKKDLLTPQMKAEVGIRLGYLYFLINHYEQSTTLLEKILDNLNNAADYKNIADASINLGACYGKLGRYKEAKALLEKGLGIYEKQPSQDKLGTARALFYLGELYRDLGNYRKAKDSFMQAYTVYEKQVSNCCGAASALHLLGIVCRELGEYGNAKDYLEKSMSIHKHHVDQTEQTHHILGSLGVVYGELGDYKKAQELLLQNLQFFQKQFSDSYEHTMRVTARLGKIYLKLGEYRQAKELLEYDLQMLRKLFPGRYNSIGRSLAYLGDVHRCLGNLEEALKLVAEALSFSEQHYGRAHIETARILQIAAKVYLTKGDLPTAEKYLMEALKTFQKSEHPEVYTVFEDLAELYLKKSSDNSPQQSPTLRAQALGYLIEARQVIKSNFPENSPHLKRIQIKMNELT